MSIIALILVLAVIGLVLWLVNTKVPMDPTFKTVMNVVVLLVVLLWLLSEFGLLSGASIPRVR